MEFSNITKLTVFPAADKESPEITLFVLKDKNGFHEVASCDGKLPEDKWFITLDNLNDTQKEAVESFLDNRDFDIDPQEANRINLNFQKNIPVFITQHGNYELNPEFLQHVMFPEGYSKEKLFVPEQEYYKVPDMYVMDTYKLDEFGDRVYDSYSTALTGDYKCIQEMKRAVYDSLVFAVEEQEIERDTEYFQKTKSMRPHVDSPDIDNMEQCKKYLAENGISDESVTVLCRRMLRQLAAADVNCVVEKIENYIKNCENEDTLNDINKNFTSYPDELSEETGNRIPVVLIDNIAPVYTNGTQFIGKPYQVEVPADVLDKECLKQRDKTYKNCDIPINHVFMHYKNKQIKKNIEYDFATGRSYTRNME